MQQITTIKKLNQILKTVIFYDDKCWRIGDYTYNDADWTDIITRAINHEDYILRKYKKVEIRKKKDIDIPNLEYILSEIVGSSYSIPIEAEEEFQSMMKELLDKYDIKDSYLDKVNYIFIEEYDIKPLIKSILEDRVSKIEENFNLFKKYKGKLERM